MTYSLVSIDNAAAVAVVPGGGLAWPDRAERRLGGKGCSEGNVPSGGGGVDQQQHQRAHAEDDSAEKRNCARRSVPVMRAKTGVFRKHARA